MKDKKAPCQSNQEDLEKLRNQAIDLYLRGHTVAEITRQLDKSRSWFYKTLGKYRRAGRAGLQESSRRPRQSPGKTPQIIEDAVVRIRKLMASGQDPVLRYGNYGADAIAAELRRTGIEPPSRATINRILHRHGLVKPYVRRGRQTRLPKDYPWPQISQAYTIHAMDFMHRSLPGGLRFYAANLLDVYCQWPFLRILTSKSRQGVTDFFVAAWQEIGLPDVLHIDNDGVWRGSSSAPHTLSFLVRLWLLLGVQVIFIPPYTPQANTWIESFNHLWDRNFWQRNHFHSLEELQQQLPYLQTYCRERRLLPGKEITPRICRTQHAPQYLLPEDFQLHHQKALPLTAGFIHFIRFVNTHGDITFLNVTWHLGPEWIGKTVRATLDTAQSRVFVYHQSAPDQSPQRIADFSFPIKEKVHPIAADFSRPKPPVWPTPS